MLDPEWTDKKASHSLHAISLHPLHSVFTALPVLPLSVFIVRVFNYLVQKKLEKIICFSVFDMARENYTLYMRTTVSDCPML